MTNGNQPEPPPGTLAVAPTGWELQNELLKSRLTLDQIELLQAGLAELKLGLRYISDEEKQRIIDGHLEGAPPLPQLTAEERAVLLKALAQHNIGFVPLSLDEVIHIRNIWYHRYPGQQVNFPQLLNVILKQLIYGSATPSAGAQAKLIETPPAPYTIDVPGFTDIVIGPVPPEVKKVTDLQRNKRFRTHKSPVLGSIKWIPGTINTLDDANDLVNTFSPILIITLKRILPRALPYLGAIIVMSDSTEVANEILAIPLQGPRYKGKAYREIGGWAHGRKTLKGESKGALRMPGLFSWYAQMLQAMRTITGYGIQLGGIFGFMSDSLWGTIAKGQGQSVIIREPPPSDPLGAACRYFMERPSFIYSDRSLGKIDFLKIVAADLLAAYLLEQYGPQIGPQNMPADLETFYVPRFTPYEEALREQLTAMGISADEPELQNMLVTAQRVTNLQRLQQSMKLQQKFLDDMKATCTDPGWQLMLQEMMLETDGIIWRIITGLDDSMLLVPEADIKIAMEMIESKIIPVVDGWKPTKTEINQALDFADKGRPSVGASDIGIQREILRLAQYSNTIALTWPALQAKAKELGVKLPDDARETLQSFTESFWGKVTIVRPKRPTTAQLKQALREIEGETSSQDKSKASSDTLKRGIARAGLTWWQGPNPPPRP